MVSPHWSYPSLTSFQEIWPHSLTYSPLKHRKFLEDIQEVQPVQYTSFLITQNELRELHSNFCDGEREFCTHSGRSGLYSHHLFLGAAVFSGPDTLPKVLFPMKL